MMVLVKERPETDEHDDVPRMIVHAEAELGSSLINVRIENADATQLLALAKIIETNGQIALAQQMEHERRNQSRIHVPGRMS